MSSLEQAEVFGNSILVKGLKLAAAVMPIRDPKLIVGPDASAQLADVIASHRVKKVLVVTSAGIVKRGQTDELTKALKQHGIESVIYDGVLPDPTFTVVNEGLAALRGAGCDAVVAFGGGSAMDTAKVIAIAAANKCRPERLAGYFKGIRKPLPLFAVPTTAGTGSETTIASVISDDESHAKAFIIDSRMIPLAAALDPKLMASVPPALTAATGMDALTHAIEAYISTISTPETDRDALEAIRLIFVNLPKAYKDGSKLAAREAMSIASYKAGRAFTRASVGYVHAISHQLGAFYGTPHGLGNAIVLPHVIAFSEQAARAKLARLAIELGLGTSVETEENLARKIGPQVVALNKKMGIPEVAIDLQDSDIPAIAKGARKEALMNYPAPRHMTLGECEELLRGLLAA
jgi:alcohol dehydrogenase